MKLHEKLFESSKKHAMMIIDFEKKKIIPLNKDLNTYASQEVCLLCTEEFKEKDVDDKKYKV